MRDESPDVTQLLAEIQAGDERARAELFACLQRELKALAHGQMNRERPDHVLQTTALVNEAYVRLVQDRHERSRNRAEFLAVAANVMRRILVDEARSRKAAKRGGGALAVSLWRAEGVAEDPPRVFEDLEALDQALARLEAHPELAKKSKVVELRFFAGLTVEETAEVLGTSAATVKRDWDFARAWLRREIERLAPES